MKSPYSTAYLKDHPVLPVKIVGANIAATSDFQKKWKGKRASIVVTDTWHGSGRPQSQLAQLMFLVSLGTVMADALVVIQDSPEGLSLANMLIEENADSIVFYDSSKTFDAIFPEGSFSMTIDEANNTANILYTGELSAIPDPVMHALSSSTVATAEDGLLFALGGFKNTSLLPDALMAMFDMFDLKPSSCDPIDDAKTALSVMSCGRLSLPDREDIEELLAEHVIPGDENAARLDAIRDAIRSHGIDTKWFPLPKSVERYTSALGECVKAFSDVQSIWSYALLQLPFSLNLDEFYGSWSDVSVPTMQKIAEATGALPMMDAYFQGVPIEDILA